MTAPVPPPAPGEGTPTLTARTIPIPELRYTQADLAAAHASGVTAGREEAIRAAVNLVRAATYAGEVDDPAPGDAETWRQYPGEVIRALHALRERTNG